MDAEEYKQKRRLRRILDARDKVEDRKNVANEKVANGEITEDQRNVVVLNAVQEYVRECYNLILDYHEEHFGPNGELLDQEQYLDDSGEWLRDEIPIDYWMSLPVGTLEMPHNDDVEFNGLVDIVYAEEVYVETWEETERHRHGPDGSKTRQRVHTVPVEVSMQAYLHMNRFLAKETNLDLEFEEETLPEDKI